MWVGCGAELRLMSVLLSFNQVTLSPVLIVRLVGLKPAEEKLTEFWLAVWETVTETVS